MAKHNQLGIYGEEMAAQYLKRAGYTILHRNWRSGHKEIDIVAVTDQEIVFVEVKTRKSADYCKPTEAVGNTKIKRLVGAAGAYIRLFGIDLPARFDVITIVGPQGDVRLEHIQGAFLPPMNH